MDSSAANGRQYKSRKTRPCDFCRRRRVTCNMPAGPPCVRCVNKGQPCTFEQGPSLRRRPALESSAQQYISESGEQGVFTLDGSKQPRLVPTSSLPGSSPGAIDMAMFLGGVDVMALFDDQSSTETGAVSAVAPGALAGQASTPDMSHPLDNRQPEISATFPIVLPDVLPMEDEDTAMDAQDTAGIDGSLEYLPGAFSFYIGPTGVTDVHLLAREPLNASNLTEARMNGLRYRRMESGTTSGFSGDAGPIFFGITDRALLDRTEPQPNPATGEAAWSEFCKILTHFQAGRLVQLYSRFVDPYFPILSKHQIPSDPESLSNIPLALLAAICAISLPFIVYDESLVPLLLNPPSSEQLYRLCWLQISEELHAPTLTTLQACLLLQQRLPTNVYLSDTAFAWSLMSTSVAVAQTIGLHRDPGSWTSVAYWERTVRRRLWWSTWSMEKWFALARGMPSHLSDDGHDVEVLTAGDIEDTLSSFPPTDSHLPHLVSLTIILSDIQQTYYSVKAIRRTANDLLYSLEVARDLRTRLKDWKDSLPPTLKFGSVPSETTTVAIVDPAAEPGFDDNLLNGSGSVHLSYIVTHMTLFRALLRPLDKWSELVHQSAELAEVLYGGAQAVIKGALLCVKEFVEFIEALTPARWNAFWHSWSRSNFAMAGFFMVYLLHIVSPPSSEDGITLGAFNFDPERVELQQWIRRWRRANRSANSASGMKGLVNLGLLRVETMLKNTGSSHRP
ncbi:fungal-specific transcription factor domain-containing protein [Xylariales sp. PMI_506]|nr:fungal-specific transcription factor domain-containing protein [Xylariales sp. PMI_506]